MFNTHYQPHYHPTTKSLWLCSSVYCRPPHQSRRIWLMAAATNQKTTCIHIHIDTRRHIRTYVHMHIHIYKHMYYRFRRTFCCWLMTLKYFSMRYHDQQYQIWFGNQWKYKLHVKHCQGNFLFVSFIFKHDLQSHSWRMVVHKVELTLNYHYAFVHKH